MKKQFKFAMSLALCAAMLPAFTACGGDDEAEEPDVPQSKDYVLTELDGYKLTYDDEDRLVSIAGNGEMHNIDYKNSQLVSSDKDEEPIYLSFNGKGFITGFSQEWDENDVDGWRETGKGEANFSYDGSGRLIKIEIYSSGVDTDLSTGVSEKYNSSLVTDLKWEGNNLVGIFETAKDEDADGVEEESMVYHIGYGSAENTYLQVPVNVSSLYLLEEEFSAMAAVGLFGVGSQNLPTSISIVLIGGSYSRNISVDQTADGLISKELFDDDQINWTYGPRLSRSAAVAAPATQKHSSLMKRLCRRPHPTK